VELDGKVIGFIGELHPRWLQKYDLPQAPVLFEVDAEALRERVVPSYAEISKFPGATRDLALVVKQDVPAQALLDAFKAELASNENGKLVQAVVLFDEYRGKGLEQDEKSLAFRFGLQDTQSTLQDDAVEAIMTALGGGSATTTRRQTARLIGSESRDRKVRTAAFSGSTSKTDEGRASKLITTTLIPPYSRKRWPLIGDAVARKPEGRNRSCRP
jgi:hypothetical protein